MVLDPMGGIVLTNDGNAILREVCKKIEFVFFYHFFFIRSKFNIQLVNQ